MDFFTPTKFNPMIKTMKKTVFVFFILFAAPALNTALAAEGNVWITPAQKSIEPGKKFNIEIHLDAGSVELGSFNIFLDFNATDITITEDGADASGITAGADLTDIAEDLSADYMISSNNTDIANGHYRFAGMAGATNQSADLYAGGNDIHIATIHAMTTTGFATGTTALSLRLEEAVHDKAGHDMKTGSYSGTEVTATENSTGTLCFPVKTESGGIGVICL